MSAIDVTDAPRNVTTRTRGTPEERAARLNARAEVILADARAKAEKRIREQAAKTLDKARRLVADAASGLDVVDAAKAAELREWAGRMPGVLP